MRNYRASVISVLSFVLLSSPIYSQTSTGLAADDNSQQESRQTPPVTESIPAPLSVKPEEPMIFVQKVNKPLNQVYKQLFTMLENNGYFIIFEPNIGKNLAHFAQRWGKDYNKNKLDEIRSMIFCNGWYANQISNHDPDMMALCPLHITLIFKEGSTKILFIRPGQVSKYSPANSIATELEQDIIRIIKESSQ